MVDAVAVRRVWDEILGYLRGKSPRTAALLREATVRDVHGETLVLLFKHSALANMMADSPDRLVEAIHETLGGQWRVRCEVAGQSPAADPPATPVARSSAAQAAGADPPSAGQPDNDTTDWPTAARPGGGAPAASTAPHPPATAPAPAPPEPSSAGKSRRAPKRTKGAATGGRAPAPRQDGGSETPAPRSSDGYVGFDPGDEPLDEVLDESTARRTSEQQAIELLQQALGAEKIGEAPAG